MFGVMIRVRKRYLAALGAAAALCAALLLKPEAKEELLLPDPESRLAYLAEQGYPAEERSCVSVVIPAQFTGVYAAYAAEQAAKELPLEAYAGAEAALYTYSVRSEDGQTPLCAELLLCGDRLVGMQVYCPIAEVEPSASEHTEESADQGQLSGAS